MQDNTKKWLTRMQALMVMRNFLEKYYEQTSSDNIGTLLGDTMILSNGSTADPAALSDWRRSIEKLTGQVINKDQMLDDKKFLTFMEAFKVMEDYLAGFVERTSSEDIAEIVKEMRIVVNESSDLFVWRYWLESVKKINRESCSNPDLICEFCSI